MAHFDPTAGNHRPSAWRRLCEILAKEGTAPWAHLVSEMTQPGLSKRGAETLIYDGSAAGYLKYNRGRYNQKTVQFTQAGTETGAPNRWLT